MAQCADGKLLSKSTGKAFFTQFKTILNRVFSMFSRSSRAEKSKCIFVEGVVRQMLIFLPDDVAILFEIMRFALTFVHFV